MTIWAFGARPSHLDELYWSHSLNDLKTIVRLKIEYRLSEKEQELENLFKIAQAIFGKGDKSKPENVNVIDSLEGAMSFMRELRSGG